jgi:hypothetical protein
MLIELFVAAAARRISRSHHPNNPTLAGLACEKLEARPWTEPLDPDDCRCYRPFTLAVDRFHAWSTRSRRYVLAATSLHVNSAPHFSGPFVCETTVRRMQIGLRIVFERWHDVALWSFFSIGDHGHGT